MVSRLEFADRFGFLPVFGMIHLTGSTDEFQIDRARDEARIYEDCGLAGAIVENYTGASLDTIKRTLDIIRSKNIKINLGVNILPNEFSDAFAIASEHGANFIQLDHVAGRYMSSNRIVLGARETPANTLDEKTYMALRAKHPEITVLGGVWPKYYHPIPRSNLDEDLMVGAKRADAIVVTGEGTGKETPLEKIAEFRRLLPDDKPLIIGAGLNFYNAFEQLTCADGAIIGSSFKYDRKDRQPVSGPKVKDMMKVVEDTRQYLIRSGFV